MIDVGVKKMKWKWTKSFGDSLVYKKQNKQCKRQPCQI